MEIEIQQAYLFLHEGQFSACELCSSRIGYYHYRIMPQEPYDLPLHRGCYCYWEETVLEGLSDAQWNELKIEHDKQLAELAEVEGQILATEAELEACHEEVVRLSQEISEVQAYALQCLEMAENQEAEAERLEEEAGVFESQDTEEGRSKAAELQLLADECRQEAERLKEEAEKADIRAQELKIEEEAKAGQIAGLEVLAQTLGIKKNEIEDMVKEMESYLEKPTLEQQAVAIAGSRLIL
jgi:hypothetical protein